MPHRDRSEAPEGRVECVEVHLSSVQGEIACAPSLTSRSRQRHALSRLDPDVFPRETADEREQCRGRQCHRRASPQRRRSRRVSARKIAPPQNIRANGPRRIAATASSWWRVGLLDSRFSNTRSPRWTTMAPIRASPSALVRCAASTPGTSDARSSAAAPSTTACATRSIVDCGPCQRSRARPCANRKPV